MDRGETGKWEEVSTVGSAAVRAFVALDLPPDPPLQYGARLRRTLDDALVSLGRLDSITTLLPDPSVFLYGYVRKEAVLSSQIEGTQSSLSDLLLFELDEAPGVALDDVREVSRYVAALEHGIRRISDGFPISNRLIRELHEILLEGGRGAASQPGEFRRSQVWIGGTHPGNASFVPPPAARVPDCMARLEAFIHADHGQGALVKAALAHAQFETIHPFLDGNGRVGRLLISLILVTEGILSQPLLYLSLYFKKHRDRYYELLQATRIEGDWEGWVQFFADGVLETAGAAVTLARDLDQLFQRDRNSLVELRNQGSLLQVLLAFQRHPVRTIRQIAEETGLSVPTVGTAIGTLEGRGLVRETTGKRRGRVYAYDEYLRLLVEGT